MSLEFIRRKNADTYIVFPILDDDGDTVNGASNLDSQYVAYGNSYAPVAFGACTYEAQELGATGVYYLHLDAAELNDVGLNAVTYVEILVTCDEGKPQNLAIRLISPVPTPPEIAASVWEELLADHQTSDTFGYLVQMLQQSMYMQRTAAYASIPVVAQGITQELIDTDEGCIQYITIKISVTRNWAAPDFTYYILYHYDADGNVDNMKADTDTTW